MTARTAVVLARGLGTRMRRPDPDASLDRQQNDAAAGGSKTMMPVDGRPFLDYILSGLADAGFARALLVVAPHSQAMRDHYEQHPPARIGVEYVVQPTPRGTADAVLAVEPRVEPAAFVVLNGDNYYPTDVLRSLRMATEPAAVLFDRETLVTGSNIDADRISAYAIVRLDAAGYVTSVEEKPATPPDDWMSLPVSMNCWRFDRAIFDACRAVPVSPRGEVELPAAVDHAVRHLGLRVHGRVVRQAVLDLSRRADVAAVAHLLRHVVPAP